jgi:hypothetical protein
MNYLAPGEAITVRDIPISNFCEISDQKDSLSKFNLFVYSKSDLIHWNRMVKFKIERVETGIEMYYKERNQNLNIWLIIHN